MIILIQTANKTRGILAATDQELCHCRAAATGRAALAAVKTITIRAMTKFQAN
tara:strand:+ start:1062 stop:1220 length:159 start_codon:yes stop_codon:yes gene_type:complete